MSLHAYELRADYAPDSPTPFLGGVVTIGDASLSIADALEQGDGRIVVDASDGAITAVLDAYPALKRTSAGDDARPTLRRYDLLSADELRAETRRRGLAGDSRDAMREQLTGQDAELTGARASNPPVPVSPDPATADDPANRGTRRSRKE